MTRASSASQPARARRPPEGMAHDEGSGPAVQPVKWSGRISDIIGTLLSRLESCWPGSQELRITTSTIAADGTAQSGRRGAGLVFVGTHPGWIRQSNLPHAPRVLLKQAK